MSMIMSTLVQSYVHDFLLKEELVIFSKTEQEQGILTVKWRLKRGRATIATETIAPFTSVALTPQTFAGFRCARRLKRGLLVVLGGLQAV